MRRNDLRLWSAIDALPRVRHAGFRACSFWPYAHPQQSRNSCCFTEAMHVSESLVLADPDASLTHQASVAELSLPPPRDELRSIWIGVGTAASF
jgi:hypothetical protein